MNYLWKTLWVCAIAAGLCGAQVPPQKKYKDQAEYEAYNAVIKDLGASDFSKALADLEAWRQKYPETEFQDDRQFLFVQSYAGAKQPARAVDSARDLVAKGASALGGAGNAVKFLFTVATAIQQVPDPTEEQLSTGVQAATSLLAFDRKPEGVSDDAWAQARSELQAAARGALLYLALTPGAQALKRNHCTAAESLLEKAIGDYPASAQAAWYLGSAKLCLYKTIPEKAPAAIYEFARAASVEPARGMVDPNWQRDTVEPYLEKIYNQYHGVDPEGLNQLKELAVKSPLPPPDLKILSVAQIAQEKEAQFAASNPQLALWLKIKAALADSEGAQYFTSTLKDSAVPQLKGVLVEAKPACRPKELLVAMPLPGAPHGSPAEIRLKLDKPMTGKPAPDTQFQWEGVPSEFTQNPFLLTMETETAKIEGLKLTPCAAATAKKK